MSEPRLAECKHPTYKVLTDENFNRYWYCLVCGVTYLASGPSSFGPDIKVREAILKARAKFKWAWHR